MPSNINHVPRVHTQQGKSGPRPGSRACSIGPVAAPSAGTAPYRPAGDATSVRGRHHLRPQRHHKKLFSQRHRV